MASPSIRRLEPYCRESRDKSGESRARIAGDGSRVIVVFWLSTFDSQLSTFPMLAKEIKPGTVVNYNDAPHIIESVTVQSPSARGSATLYKFRARNLVTK